jgi:hypothetical protein
MTTFRSKSVRRAGGRALLFAPLVALAAACTDLSEVPQDALTPETAFKTESEVLAGVAAVYANLRSIEWVGYVTLGDLTTDVAIVPTRGSDWYDNGRWLEIHRQDWTASSGSALDDMNGTWNNLFSGVAKANLMLEVVEGFGGENAPVFRAELRALRAWYYYMLQDMFGGVPLATTTELMQHPRATRSEVFAFIEQELTEARADLPAAWPASNYGRMTQGAVDAILASLYINAGVFNRDAGVNATGYNSCNVPVSGGISGCEAAIDAADAVINSGEYDLNPDWNKNFSHDNHLSPENIFVVVHVSEQGLGMNPAMRTLHYNQLSTGDGGPWNGFATLAETYQAFEPTDVRRSMWLEGQAFSFETGQAVNDRTGNPLIFTAVIADANEASEAEGVRFNKFPPLPSAPSGNGHPNDFPFFRLTEMHLIKAEALNEMGQTGDAITELKIVHDLRNPANPISTGLSQAQVRDAILLERLLEFAGEGKRRTDLVRHGKFLNQWSTTMANGKVDKTGSPHLILFPIPSTQIQSNPLLTQNPGY